MLPALLQLPPVWEGAEYKAMGIVGLTKRFCSSALISKAPVALKLGLKWWLLGWCQRGTCPFINLLVALGSFVQKPPFLPWNFAVLLWELFTPLIFGAVPLSQVLRLRARRCEFRCGWILGGFGQLENAKVGFKGLREAFGVGLVCLLKGDGGCQGLMRSEIPS